MYGRLDAWALREESHLEKPWKDREHVLPAVIPTEEVRDYFRAKFRSGNVEPPRHFGLAGNFELDGIPARFQFSTFRDLASFVRTLANST